MFYLSFERLFLSGIRPFFNRQYYQRIAITYIANPANAAAGTLQTLKN